MSISEPETPKPDNAVDQEVTNALDNLKAENEKLRQELEEARSQLVEQNPAPAIDLPDAAAILQEIRENQKNQPEQKSRRSPPKAQKIWTLKDIEEVLEAIAQTKNP